MYDYSRVNPANLYGSNGYNPYNKNKYIRSPNLGVKQADKKKETFEEVLEIARKRMGYRFDIRA